MNNLLYTTYTIFIQMKGGNNMSDKTTNVYDDDNIPEIDLPKEIYTNTINCHKTSSSKGSNCSETKNFTKDPLPEPLPESTRPRQDGPGGN